MLTEQEKHDLAMTIAGEIDPRYSPYGTEENRLEIASILANIENRFAINRPSAFRETDKRSFKDRSDVVKQPWQYSTWNDVSGQRNAQRNFERFGEHITEAIEDFSSGKLEAPTPLSTHYWAPATMRAIAGRSHPRWHGSIKDRSYVGPHLFGTEKSLMDDVQRLHIENNIVGPEHGAPVPSGRGVSLSEHLADRIENYPGPSWSDQFAPGPKAAPKRAISQPVRDDCRAAFRARCKLCRLLSSPPAAHIHQAIAVLCASQSCSQGVGGITARIFVVWPA